MQILKPFAFVIAIHFALLWAAIAADSDPTKGLIIVPAEQCPSTQNEKNRWDNATFEALPGNLVHDGRVALHSSPNENQTREILSEKFCDIGLLEKLPLAVRDGLAWMTKQDRLFFANPNEPCQKGCSVENPPLPERALYKAYLSDNYCIVVYEHIWGSAESMPMLIFMKERSKVHCILGSEMVGISTSIPELMDRMKKYPVQNSDW